MDMTGSQRIEASREIVWAALNDPEVLRTCIPGCETIEQVGETEFQAKITVKLGPLRTTFAGKVTLLDLDPPNSYTITGSGSGGAAGFASGSANVRLEADRDATILSYAVKAALGGRLALGAKLVDATAKTLAEQFFAQLGRTLVPPTDVDVAQTEGERRWFALRK
jgi:carbon monoxide dehydrogenase subunit G